ncbi:hypothetical protein O181_020440 [Austropuccinia psidii MF-1]|uniref:GAG-pre-integrase domain-containing protein n=1 Tax=Austropuccinia psidii MF-1 TaxID=1389203 RepID=A0A9Q3CCK7_9BASI|nr:hypothetical protein [Austropuccinia psidii MF-1]
MTIRNKINYPRPSVAQIGAFPALQNNEILLDSGATQSVVGDLSLLIYLKSANMKLSVASSEQFDIGALRSIKLNTNFGQMVTKGVFYCAAIPVIVLSTGQLLDQGAMGDRKYFSHKRNCCWFIAMDVAAENVSIKPILIDQIPPSINLSTWPGYSYDKECSYLWHQRMGHLSIRNIRCLMKFNALEGLHSNKINDLGIFHPFSIAKSKHRPIKYPLRKRLLIAGDMILADLIGPLPFSIDKKQYALII